MLTSSNSSSILVVISIALLSELPGVASVSYGILCSHSSMWMLELIIQGDVCEGLDGAIETLLQTVFPLNHSSLHSPVQHSEKT